MRLKLDTQTPHTPMQGGYCNFYDLTNIRRCQVDTQKTGRNLTQKVQQNVIKKGQLHMKIDNKGECMRQYQEEKEKKLVKINQIDKTKRKYLKKIQCKS